MVQLSFLFSPHCNAASEADNYSDKRSVDGEISRMQVFFFEIHFRAPWGTEPYVALHHEYLYVTDASVSVFSFLPFPLKPPHRMQDTAI